MFAPVVGVLIVVHNRKDDLLRLISSIFLSDYKSFDILVLDNDSSVDLSDVELYPSLEYIKLKENIGFVSGMIEGLTYLLQKGEYQYLWVLDSDLEVAPDALGHLVDVFKEHDDIGVAGCMTYNIYNHKIIVESGADVDLRSGIVTARNCNASKPLLENLIAVDFVASGGGGSLINVQALLATGLHDDRYHFLWEDTDFGLCLRNHGFRSVVVSDAIVYHPPFTEKRNPNIYAYYGVRNPLLTVSKYTSSCKLPLYLMCNLKRYLRIALLMMFSGSKGFARLTFKAIFDYILGRFGKAELYDINQSIPSKKLVDLSKEYSTYIIGTGSRESIEALIEFIKIQTQMKICLIVQDYRKTLFEGINVDQIIIYDDRSLHAIREYLKIGTSILSEGGCVINTDLKVASPLGYFGWRGYDWDDSSGQLYRSRQCIYSLWKPAASVALGNLLAILFLPAVWIAALKHKRQKPVMP